MNILSKTDVERYQEKFLENIKSPQVGDIYFHTSGRTFFKILKIQKNGRVKLMETFDGITWEKFDHRTSLSDLQYYYKKIHLQDGETPEQAIQSLLKDLMQALIDPSFLEVPEEGAGSMALITTGGKKFYEDTALQLLRMQARADIMSELAKGKMDAISHIAYELANKLRKVMRVLGILEVYLGVHEEIFQLTQGTPAPMDEPISVRQSVLYMDEEAAIVRAYHDKNGMHTEGDITGRSVEDFDRWLLEGDNLDRILPELKGIVALRASRQNRYDDLDPMSRIQRESEDRMCYLLIRNGQNLYRIWTNLVGEGTLFPTLEDSVKIGEMFQADWTHEQEKAEDEKAKWVTNALLIQGLADRTEVFQPMPQGRIDFINPDTFEEGGRVRLIRDAENLLADGHESFHAWMKRINLLATRGTRIFFRGVEWSKDGHGDRFIVFYERGNYPAVPKPGLYSVEQSEIRKTYWSNGVRFLYLPNDPTYWRPYIRWSDRKDDTRRKKRYSFDINQDEFINYDELDIPTLDYFLQSRLERKDYRHLMPTLLALRKLRLDELAVERGFVKLLADKHHIPESVLLRCVEWWKRKVINKRPISQDDAKAWRMIIRKAKG